MAARAAGTEPLESVPAGENGMATTFSAAGRIEQIDRRTSKLAFFSKKPFWGPPHYGWSRFALWPADTVFIVSVPGPTPITIDGKKVGFAQLAVGQIVDVQYNVAVNWKTMFCVARRIDGRTSPPVEHPIENRGPRKKK